MNGVKAEPSRFVEHDRKVWDKEAAALQLYTTAKRVPGKEL